MKRKILYISGNRADYGFMEPVLTRIQDHPKLEIEVIATGMHLMPEFGSTIKDIRRGSVKVHEIDAVFDTTPLSALHFIGSFLRQAPDIIQQIGPDIILVAGDRVEMLAGSIAAAYMSIPLAHVSGGDVTSTIDEHIRHAITKLAQIHFPYTNKSAKRIYFMGEDRWRIFTVGSPGVEMLLKEQLLDSNTIRKKYRLDPKRPYIITIQHPVTTEASHAADQMMETLSAIEDLGLQTILIYPNVDNGGRDMIRIINKYKHNNNFHIFKSISRREFISLMKHAALMVGNSSSGIVEAASFSLPVINIGSRQDGRERGKNVIDTGNNKDEIKKAIHFAFNDPAFREQMKTCKNPYEKEGSAEAIAYTLATIPLNFNLLQKKIRY